MRLSKSYFFTIREDSKDEDSVSGNLLVRAGMIKKSSSGVYMMLPLGERVLKKIESVIREEMNAIDSQELSMPVLIPEEIYVNSGRRDLFGSSMFSLKDRFDKDFVLGPTHEELFASAAKMYIKSYRNLPFSLYQFQRKFRDEPRPRFGLIRVREFIMKDSYTFDLDVEGLKKSYSEMFEAYKRIFNRLELEYVIVKADTGVMGGLLSEEFQAVTDIGEDVLVLGESTDYSSNIEVAACYKPPVEEEEEFDIELIHTPDAKTIKQVSDFLGESEDSFVKTLLYMVDDKPFAVCVRGDHEVNEFKLLKLLEGFEARIAEEDEVKQYMNCPVGFVGPVSTEVPVILDYTVVSMHNFIVGANKTDYHYKNTNISDINVFKEADVRLIKEGDLTEDGSDRVLFKKGIEIGNTFMLGDKYSKAFDLFYVNNKGERIPTQMGSYGIGLGRCLAAMVEQNNLGDKIVWPKHIAPIQVAIVVINTKNEEQMNVALDLYDRLNKLDLDVCLDDRDERAGIKFNDMELIGVPYRITIGRTIKDNQYEVKLVDCEQSKNVHFDRIESDILEYFS